jgi:hypothetical protein
VLGVTPSFYFAGYSEETYHVFFLLEIIKGFFERGLVGSLTMQDATPTQQESIVSEVMHRRLLLRMKPREGP